MPRPGESSGVGDNRSPTRNSACLEMGPLHLEGQLLNSGQVHVDAFFVADRLQVRHRAVAEPLGGQQGREHELFTVLLDVLPDSVEVTGCGKSADQSPKGDNRVRGVNDPVDPLLDPVALLVRQLYRLLDDLEARPGTTASATSSNTSFRGSAASSSKISTPLTSTACTPSSCVRAESGDKEVYRQRRCCGSDPRDPAQGVQRRGALGAHHPQPGTAG